MPRLVTRWGRNLDRDHVLEEYPRPGLVRDSYLNLNGTWEYAIRKAGEPLGSYDGTILVPFSPESALSGVERQLMPDEFLFYRRTIDLPQTFLEGRCLLHFGAVDLSCSVFLNGSPAGSHTGGYLPFTLDVTDYVRSGKNEISLEVQDPSDTSWHARGKQKLKPEGMWYTAQSGIWQTVWMECVPEHFIHRLWMEPDFDARLLRLRVITREQKASDPKRKAGAADSSPFVPENPGKCRVRVLFQNQLLSEAWIPENETAALKIPEENFHPWSPEQPNLYDLEIDAGNDHVVSYFGMRKVHVARDGKGILRFFLNNAPYFHCGVLDQGYWPDGMYTAPSDQALIEDILQMKKLGFNMMRKHIKIEADRWYYHCDRLGMLVWQDMVNGGGNYDMNYLCNLPNIMVWTQRHISDGTSHYRKFARENPEGRAEYYAELRDTIEALHEHPSIVAWVPFNEGWGQFDAPKATAMIRATDPGRLVDEASGWFDQKGGDMYSIHNYFFPLKVRPQPDRVVALTECGGYSCIIEGHSICNKAYGYRKYKNSQALEKGLRRLWEKELIPAVKHGLSAIVFTQVSDVETELNGLLTWDREELKVRAEFMQEMNKEIRRQVETGTETGTVYH